jgi:hypothetical protein
MKLKSQEKYEKKRIGFQQWLAQQKPGAHVSRKSPTASLSSNGVGALS